MQPNLRLPGAARMENAKRLAAATGLTPNQADEQLDLPIVVSVADGDPLGANLVH
jgi:hypothetical protein